MPRRPALAVAVFLCLPFLGPSIGSAQDCGDLRACANRFETALRGAYLEDAPIPSTVEPPFSDMEAQCLKLAASGGRSSSEESALCATLSGLLDDAAAAQQGRLPEEDERIQSDRLARIAAALRLDARQRESAHRLYSRRVRPKPAEASFATAVEAKLREPLIKEEDRDLISKSIDAIARNLRSGLRGGSAGSELPGDSASPSAPASGQDVPWDNEYSANADAGASPPILAKTFPPRSAPPAPVDSIRQEEGKDSSFGKNFARGFSLDGKVMDAIGSVTLEAEQRVDSGWKSQTYSHLWSFLPRTFKVTLAAQERAASYRYGSEMTFNKDFGTDLSAEEMAAVDHYFMGRSFGAVPGLGAVACAGASAAYDLAVPFVRRLQGAKSDPDYDTRQFGTDLHGCLTSSVALFDPTPR
ncbi:MAG: hypothetical protein WCU88_08345 [Elusimicrobiota bacterium]|jgi:hypothetical protein